MWIMDVLISEFFWGIILGLILSIAGGYALAIFQTKAQEKANRNLIRNFSIDTVRNLKQIIEEMDEIRQRTAAIYPDFLVLMEVEIGVFGRNREHLVRLDGIRREKVRKFINSCAIKKAEIAASLDDYYQQIQLANSVLAQGDGPRSQRIGGEADQFLAKANAAADHIVQLARNSSSLISELEQPA